MGNSSIGFLYCLKVEDSEKNCLNNGIKNGIDIDKRNEMIIISTANQIMFRNSWLIVNKFVYPGKQEISNF